MTVLNQSEEIERTGKKEHVVFLVVQRPNQAQRRPQPSDGQSKVQKEEAKKVSVSPLSMLLNRKWNHKGHRFHFWRTMVLIRSSLSVLAAL